MSLNNAVRSPWRCCSVECRISLFLRLDGKLMLECPVQALARQALPIVWDFAEVCPWTNATGSVVSQANRMADAAESACIPFQSVGQVQSADAANHPLPDQAADVWFTDPPYYDAIPYADLADFFLVWLKRMLPDHPILRDPFAPENLLSPKAQECVWNQAYEFEGRPKDAAFFESTISKAFEDGRRILSEDGIASIVFAHQTTQGWEAFLGGLVSAGWTVTASWPIATEMASRIRARDNASLATSVHLICRPRPDDAPVSDWGDVLRELPRRVADWMERLQGEGTRGADLVFACIGPALEIFSRYRAVETAEGRDVGLPEYLEKVWEVVGRTALENILGTAEAKARNGAMGALEEDARLTPSFSGLSRAAKPPGRTGRQTQITSTPAPRPRRGDSASPSTWCAVSPSPWASTSTAGPVALSARRREWCA